MKNHLNLTQALEQICPLSVSDISIPKKKVYHRQPLGENNVTYGCVHNYVKISLHTTDTAGKYDTLVLEHHREGHICDKWLISLTDPKFRPDGSLINNNSLDTGGHFWTYTHEWYNYMPVGVYEEVGKILGFAFDIAQIDMDIHK